MKNLVSIFLLFIFGTLWGQEAPAADEIKNVFWKITSPKNKTVSYLFGTIHMIDKDKYVLPKTVTKQLTNSKKVFLELENLTNQLAVMELSMLKEGRMTDILNKAQRDSVYSYANDEFDMDSVAFEAKLGQFKPLVFTQLTMLKLSFRTKSYDKEFSKLATTSEIPVHGLETVEEQMSFFDSMSEELNVELIMSTIKNKDSYKEDWEDMQNLYLKQDISALVEMDKGSVEMTEFTETVMMKNRNEKWIVKLDEELEKGETFVGVGAAHLVGNHGLIQLLKEKGYKVKPVKIDLTKK